MQSSKTSHLQLLVCGIAAVLTRGFAVMLLLGSIVLAAPPARAQTYDLAADWSITANPNGAWTYGRMDASLNFFPFTSTVDAAYLGDFTGPQPSWNGGYPMVLGKSTETCIHDFPLDRVGGHTYNDSNYMAVRWTAPTGGRFDISGGAWMFREIGRADLISLYINGVALFDDVLIPARSAGNNSGATFRLGDAMIADGRSASALLQVPLAAGDTVTLAVRKTAASPYGDYVGVDLTITVTNDAPLATDDFYGMSQGGSLIVPSPGILANDSDPDEDPLTVELVAGPANATSFQLDPNGSFTYTPSPSFSGVDSFTYSVTDGTSNTIAIVYITVRRPEQPTMVTGNGSIRQDGRRCTFSFNVRMVNGQVEGSLAFQDRSAGVEVTSLVLQGLVVSDTANASFWGTCSIIGVGGYTFTAEVHDGGPGGADTVSFEFGDGSVRFVYASTLAGGNIVIHGN